MTDLPDSTAPEGYDSWEEFNAAVDASTETISANSLEELQQKIEEYAEENDIDIDNTNHINL